MKFDIVSIFPTMIPSGLAEGVVGRGIASGLIDLQVHDLREFTTDRHRSVDDVPYGGGPGMVMKPEPSFAAVKSMDPDKSGSVQSIEEFATDLEEKWKVGPKGTDRGVLVLVSLLTIANVF